MQDHDKSRDVESEGGLAELADLILAVGRLIRPPTELTPPMCTPVESSVMRFIDRHPGSSARQAAEATLLPSSNFARVLKGLEDKGLVRRETDARDKRGIQLYPTSLSQQNRGQLQAAWEEALAGSVDDPADLQTVVKTLRQIEERLTTRAHGR